MDRLWAPWRMNYIMGEKEPGCIFCDKFKEERDSENLILHRGQRAYIILNLYPYNNGHLMVVPYHHVYTTTELDNDTLLEILSLTNLCIKLLDQVMHPQGYNLGFNIGQAGGAGIREHIHLHVVPRWDGDTNFMPVLAETRVMPEMMETTFKKLKEALNKSRLG